MVKEEDLFKSSHVEVKDEKKNTGRDSGIPAYEYDEDHILVRFHDGMLYEYRKQDIGELSFEEMCRLAENGQGLNSYINRNRHISKGYYSKRRG